MSVMVAGQLVVICPFELFTVWVQVAGLAVALPEAVLPQGTTCAKPFEVGVM
uniref:Uncharacterized protein n=1 Tax=mine drainage metagenome TaxID=410659 RepID=E6QN45_9ZZZZ